MEKQEYIKVTLTSEPPDVYGSTKPYTEIHMIPFPQAFQHRIRSCEVCDGGDAACRCDVDIDCTGEHIVFIHKNTDKDGNALTPLPQTPWKNRPW